MKAFYLLREKTLEAFLKEEIDTLPISDGTRRKLWLDVLDFATLERLLGREEGGAE